MIIPRSNGWVGIRTVASSALLAVLLASPTAAAQDEATPADVTVQVEQYATSAYEYAQKGEFSEAIALYLKAHQLRPTATLLYNIAAIYDLRLEEFDLAQEYYSRFLKAPDADPRLVEKANRRLLELRQREQDEKAGAESSDADDGESELSESEPAGAEPSQSEPASAVESSAGSTKTVGVVLVVAGAVVTATGLGFGGAALNEKKKADDGECTSAGCTQAGIDLIDRGQTYALISTIGVVAGVALAAGGIVLWSLSEDKEHARLEIAPQPGGAIAHFGGTF